MRWYQPKTFFMLALCLLQLGAPIIGLTSEPACDPKPVQACNPMPCCQTEASTRMACCDEQASPARDEQTPATPASPLRIYFDLAAPISFAEVGDEMGWTAKPDYIFSSINTHFAGNRLYKLLAVFLI